ncbi:MAG: hypothetical protein PHI12_06760 [Dehalococcoidales bacterium]|nr:hypothetical protein [Dehalococcoidales bacterium]
MMKTIIVGIVAINPTNPPVLAPGDGLVDVEICYRDGSPIFRTKLIDELGEYALKRVMITIEALQDD